MNSKLSTDQEVFAIPVFGSLEEESACSWACIKLTSDKIEWMLTMKDTIPKIKSMMNCHNPDEFFFVEVYMPMEFYTERWNAEKSEYVAEEQSPIVADAEDFRTCVSSDFCGIKFGEDSFHVTAIIGCVLVESNSVSYEEFRKLLKQKEQK